MTLAVGHRINRCLAPLYCINSRRVYDLVAVFGNIKVTDFYRSMIVGSASPRCFIHMQPNSATAMKLLVTYWQLIDTADKHQDTQKEINEAEHMFHQLLLQKKSEYSSSIGKRGNIFAMTLKQGKMMKAKVSQPKLNH